MLHRLPPSSRLKEYGNATSLATLRAICLQRPFEKCYAIASMHNHRTVPHAVDRTCSVFSESRLTKPAYCTPVTIWVTIVANWVVFVTDGHGVWCAFLRITKFTSAARSQLRTNGAPLDPASLSGQRVANHCRSVLSSSIA